MNPQNKLSVGIVTYNNREMIGEALQSLVECIPPELNPEIVVFDNASSDGTPRLVAEIAQEHQEIRLIEGTENVGFGAGHNKILEQIDATYHAICNPDIVVHPGSIEALLAMIKSDERIAVVTPKFLNPDNTLQRLNHPHPTIFDLFLRRFAPGYIQELFKNRIRRYNMCHVGYDTVYDLEFASGAFMFCRVECLRDAGGFDPRFFLYFEDADLSRTLQSRGWRCVFCPDAVVTHRWKREAYNNYSGTKRSLQSAFLYFRKWGWQLF